PVAPLQRSHNPGANRHVERHHVVRHHVERRHVERRHVEWGGPTSPHVLATAGITPARLPQRSWYDGLARLGCEEPCPRREPRSLPPSPKTWSRPWSCARRSLRFGPLFARTWCGTARAADCRQASRPVSPTSASFSRVFWR